MALKMTAATTTPHVEVKQKPHGGKLIDLMAQVRGRENLTTTWTFHTAL